MIKTLEVGDLVISVLRRRPYVENIDKNIAFVLEILDEMCSVKEYSYTGEGHLVRTSEVFYNINEVLNTSSTFWKYTVKKRKKDL